MVENRRPQAAARRLRCVLALAGDYLKYLFMRRRRLLHKVARRTLALIHRHGDRKNRHHLDYPSSWSSRALMEHEFSCCDSPSPGFVAAKRLLRSRLLKGGGAAAAGAVSSCFGSFRAPCGGSQETMAAASEAEAAEEEEVETEYDDDDDDDDEQQVAEDCWVQCSEIPDVDDRAEEFINMFYEQLKAQSFDAVFMFSP